MNNVTLRETRSQDSAGDDKNDAIDATPGLQAQKERQEREAYHN